MNVALDLTTIQAPAPWSAVFVAGAFPECGNAGAARKKLVARYLFDPLRSGNAMLYANTNHLHENDLWKEFVGNARDWNLEPGIGVFPNDPPRLMTADDFYAHELSKKMRTMLDPVLAITPPDMASAAKIFEVISGYGNTVVMISSMDGGALSLQLTEHTRPFVKGDTFRTFDSYVPLLNVVNAGCLSCAALEGVDFYVRECPEENGTFIASREPVQPALETAGAHFEPTQKAWYFSA